VVSKELKILPPLGFAAGRLCIQRESRKAKENSNAARSGEVHGHYLKEVQRRAWQGKRQFFGLPLIEPNLV
jgi:hypothetical protein